MTARREISERLVHHVRMVRRDTHHSVEYLKMAYVLFNLLGWELTNAERSRFVRYRGEEERR